MLSLMLCCPARALGYNDSESGTNCDWNKLQYFMEEAPKLGGRRERPNSATVMMYLLETLTAKLCCLEGLAILVSKASVSLSRVGSVGWIL